MKINNMTILGIFSSVLLLVIVVTASFAYFGSFNVNLINNVAVNVNAVSPGNATLVSKGATLNLQVPVVNMSQTNAGTLAQEANATLTVELTGAEDLSTTCTYDVVYEYDSSSNVYGSGTTTKNGDKEITMQVTSPNGTNNFSSEKNFDSTTISSYKSGTTYTLVSGVSITSKGTKTSQDINIIARYYNLNVSQDNLAGKAFTGKIYAVKKSCEISDGMPITTLLSTSTPDVYDENGLRYEGADPNNYICLDSKTEGACSDISLLFRIIGLFDEDYSTDGTNSAGTMKLLKILDTNNYGGSEGKYWNERGTNGKNENDWSIATLKTELNGTYLSTLLATSGVNSKLENAIIISKWHLGGGNGNSESNYYQYTMTTKNWYKSERSPYTESGTLQNLRSGNPEYVFAKVGLMYPSDYGYASVGGSTTNKAGCRAKELYNWDSSSYSDCKNNDWLFNSATFVNSGECLISPHASSSSYAAILDLEGSVPADAIVNRVQRAVRPTFYLNSSILKIVGGEGTKDNAYRLG